MTAKELYALANSVATARKMGIRTVVADSAPDALEKAESILEKMLSKIEENEPSAPSMSYDGNAMKVVNYSRAVDELRNALNGGHH